MVEKVAELSMRLGQRDLAPYGATRSRHDFTQPQLMSRLILCAYLRTTYRGGAGSAGGKPVVSRTIGHDRTIAAFYHPAKIRCPQPDVGDWSKAAGRDGQIATAQGPIPLDGD